MKNCIFCEQFPKPVANKTSIFQRNFPHLDSRIIWETENFIVTPTIGSLVEGYVIIVTKKHYLSMGHIPSKNYEEFHWVVSEVQTTLQSVYQNSCVLFEHGPCSNSNTGGSCVNHAHLHIVPLGFDLIRHIKLRNYESDDYPLSARCLLELGKPYIYLQQNIGNKKNSVLADATNLPSQYFRRIIAEQIGKPDEWDWAIFIGKSEIEATINTLRPIFAKHK